MTLNNILGARKVSQDELREGDKIYVLRKEPELVVRVKDGDGDLETEEDYYDPKHYDFYLAEREYVKIPADAGRVIELITRDNEKQRWLSWKDFTQGKVLWVKAENGTRQSMPFMQQRADAAKSWEVVL